MRILVLAGTGFVGRAVVALLAQRHAVAVFHRGIDCRGDAGIFHIHGERASMSSHRAAIAHFAPNVVLDMTPQNGTDAQATIAAVRGICGRVVAISSGSVYRSFGVLMRTEPGPLDNRAYAENDALRVNLYPYRGPLPRSADDPRAWLDDYDKIPAERELLAAADLEVSIVRLPLVYGPGDPDGRVARYAREMRSGAESIPLCGSAFAWRNSRTSLANAAEAIVRVVEHGRGGGIYNVAEPDDFAEAEWITQIGTLLGWPGRIVPVPDGDLRGMPVDDLPPHANFAQNLRLDSRRIRDELDFVEVTGVDEGLCAALAL